MFQKILVAHDGTGPGDIALHRGAELARLCKAELHVLGVVATAGGMLLDPAVVSDELLETERTYLRDALDASVHELRGKGVKAMACIRDGAPAYEIVDYAHEIKADLVVVGHSAKGLLACWFEGSVGSSLLAQMPCNVLVVTDGVHSSP
ncbi:universal stress protein [Novosphingobium sp. KACC 22771]|uniref:universal stress protein n=1 Tax=Novosphingobium sp. KACC 22771 TaxID=3025670 RepID=UPI0023657A04|nr:universal stress protein [Novosphingobium sp. KACC 22771]WDF72492.1 universal stress protein [Novosphingobium sp. KACC 22771]